MNEKHTPPAGASDAGTDALIDRLRTEAHHRRERHHNGLRNKETARLLDEAADALTSKAEVITCTCPSGDGSLRWPCPEHPPAQAAGSGTGDAASRALLFLRDMETGSKEWRAKRRDEIVADLTKALAAQPAPVVGGVNGYAEQHARDSKELRRLCEARDFYKHRCESLQAVQSNMRDPERKAVCDILANGTTTALSARPAVEGGDTTRLAQLELSINDLIGAVAIDGSAAGRVAETIRQRIADARREEALRREEWNRANQKPAAVEGGDGLRLHFSNDWLKRGIESDGDLEPSASSQISQSRFFIDHGIVHDRKTGKHLRGTDEYGDKASDLLAVLHELEAAIAAVEGAQGTSGGDEILPASKPLRDEREIKQALADLEHEYRMRAEPFIAALARIEAIKPPTNFILGRLAPPPSPEAIGGDWQALHGMWRAMVNAGGATTVARWGAGNRQDEWATAVLAGMLAIERHFHPDRFDSFCTGTQPPSPAASGGPPKLTMQLADLPVWIERTIQTIEDPIFNYTPADIANGLRNMLTVLAETPQGASGGEPVAWQWRLKGESDRLWTEATKEQVQRVANDPDWETRVLYATPPPSPVASGGPEIMVLEPSGFELAIERGADGKWRCPYANHRTASGGEAVVWQRRFFLGGGPSKWEDCTKGDFDTKSPVSRFGYFALETEYRALYTTPHPATGSGGEDRP